MTLPSAFRDHSNSSSSRRITGESYFEGSHRSYKTYEPSMFSNSSKYNDVKSLKGPSLAGIDSTQERTYPTGVNAKTYKSSREFTTTSPRNKSTKYGSYQGLSNYRYDLEGESPTRNRINTNSPGSASSTSSGGETISSTISNLPLNRRRPLPYGPGPLLPSQEVGFRRKGSDISTAIQTTPRGPLRADHHVTSLETQGRYGSRNKTRQIDMDPSMRPKPVKKRSQSLDNVHRYNLTGSNMTPRRDSSSGSASETAKRKSFGSFSRTPSLSRLNSNDFSKHVEQTTRRLDRLTMLSNNSTNRSSSPTFSAVDGLSNGKQYANENKIVRDSATSSIASPTLIRDASITSDTYLLSDESVSLNSFSPRGNSNAVNGIIGFKNLGNTCFMNSIIQCLRNLKQLRQIFISNDFRQDLNDSSSTTKGKIAKSFADVVRNSWDQSNIPFSVLSLASLKTELQQFAPRFCGYDQQDSQEFLRFLLEGLHEDLNIVREKPKLQSPNEYNVVNGAQAWKQYEQMEKSKITSLFVGQLKSALTCSVCNFTSVSFDPFWDLSLPMPKNERNSEILLKECFDIFTQEETLDGEEQPSCEKCQTHRKCTKKFSIERFPQILVLHLKRFSGLRYRAKLSTSINFPFSLSLSSYSSTSGTDVSYSLAAVSNHMGSTYSGHYTAYCKHPENGNWYSYNDCRVAKIAERDVVSPSAYVMFYELNTATSSL